MKKAIVFGISEDRMGVVAEQEKEQKKKDKSSAVQQKQTVQRDLSDVNGPEGGMLPNDVSARIQSKRGSGQRLSDRQIKSYSEKFGRDMSDVHVHTDAESDTISRSLNARAFTIGSDVFLTKGINPEGSGRDAQTMTHELTHVVQQGGHASSGPLKLGAADTAQEHEAAATAQREFSPEKTETEEDTVQRGFLGDLGSMVGHNLLNMVGMEDAYNATYGAKHKVQNAVSQLEEPESEEFSSNEESIAQMENTLEELKGELPATEDGPEREALYKRFTETSNELGELRQKQLEIVQKVDSSISDSDMVQFRNKNSGKSMILGKLGGSIMAGFARGGQKDAARARGMQSAANYGAGASNYKGKPAAAKPSADKDAEVQELKAQVEELKKQMAAMLQTKGGATPSGATPGGATPGK